MEVVMDYTSLAHLYQQDEIVSVRSRSAAPVSVCGGFNRSWTAYSVDRSGRLKVVGRSNDCTLQGDAPSQPLDVAAMDSIPHLLLVWNLYGNGGWQTAELYTRSPARFDRILDAL